MSSETVLGMDEQQLNAVPTRFLPLLRFPPALEAAYEQETGPARSRELFWRGWLGLALYFAMLLSDWYVTPDVFGTALLFRLGMTPIVLVMLFIIWHNPPVVVRESFLVVVMLLVAGSFLYLMLFSTAPTRESQLHVLVLLVLFMAVQRVPFYYALAGCLGVWALYHLALFPLGGLLPAELVTDEIIFGGAVVLCLIAIYDFERATRLSYLTSLRERLLNLRLISLSRQDPLTGLANRRALEEILGAMEIGRSGSIHLAVLMIDVDHFKFYNDSLGHQEGDVCLRRISGIIRSELRERGDMAFRFGGEEFLILLLGLDLPAAVAIGERVRQAIEAAAIPHPAEPTGRTVVTVSVGAAAMIADDGVNAAGLVAAADAALYEAKRNGRNLVYPPMGEGGAEQAVVSENNAAAPGP
ncbi:MAG TPA: GGDEF domain-containing protein [Rhizobium sp.]|nr:GGDEF domain-containing protein [Rhizobium sp.]